MAYNTKTVKRDGSGITPVPQHFNPTADDYEAILGRNGASRVELYGPDGNPISTSSGKLAVRATEIESLLNDIKGKDFATQTTLEAILAKLIATPATEAKQDTLISHVDGMESALASILAKLIDAPATEAKQDTLISHVDGVESALASILAKLIDAPATEAKQDALAALIGEVDADPTANTLLARLKSLEDKIAAIDSVLDAIVDGSTPAVTQLSGSYVEIGGVSFAVSGGDTLRGKSADKPDAVAAHAVIPFCYYFSIDTGVVEATDGTNWVVI